MKQSLLALILFSLTRLNAAPVPAPQAKPVKKPKLVLAIAIDQFRYDYTERFRDQYTGGLARLLTQGAVYIDAHQDHFPTVTATGHAALLSGSVPEFCGIVANEWYDRETGKTVTSVEDSGTKLVGIGGNRIGSSPHNLIVSTIPDEIKMSGSGNSKTIGISMKDRAAILPGGRMSDAAYWLDAKTGVVVSSSYFMPGLPTWVQKFNSEAWPEKWVGAVWHPLNKNGKLPPVLMTLPAKADAKYFSEWAKTPYANETIEALAERALTAEELGKHDGIDVLTVSFSANDHLGHAVGPDAPEVEDMSIRTDRVLEKLLNAAEKQAGGKDNLIVVLSADHGVAPVPEVMAQRHMPGGRLNKKQFLATISDALTAKFGPGDWILASGEGASVYLNSKLIAEKKLKASEVENEVAKTAAAFPFVARTYTRTELLKHVAPESEVDRLVARGFYPERSPDVIIVAKPYYLFGAEGTSHGTPYNYDTHVPLIFYGFGISAGVHTEHVGISDVAPTLAALMHIQTPSGSVGKVLEGVAGR
jgi:predicted AlkP superfamily pyrophosphatase or phosphodiesterase